MQDVGIVEEDFGIFNLNKNACEIHFEIGAT
jgi:hypothetical protein